MLKFNNIYYPYFSVVNNAVNIRFIPVQMYSTVLNWYFWRKAVHQVEERKVSGAPLRKVENHYTDGQVGLLNVYGEEIRRLSWISL